MTIEDAGRHLGVTPRTVRSYIRRSLLTTSRAPGSKRKWLRPDEVEELRKDLVEGSGSSVGDLRREVLELRVGVRQLRSEMDLVLHILDAPEAPLHLDGVTARELHDAATAQLRSTAWSTEELVRWADIFLRVQEEDLLVLQRAVGGVAWSPFLRLCVAMIVYAQSRPDYATSLDTQLAHRRLTEARRRLRTAATCFTHMYGSTEDASQRELRRAALLDAPESVRESLLRRAQRKSGAPTT